MNEGGEVPTSNLGEPPPARPTLETQYKGLATSLARCDGLIPKKGLQVWKGGLHGNRVDKQKEFKAAGAVDHIRVVLKDRFPDQVQENQVVTAANDFLGKVASHLQDKYYETVPFGQLDRFLIGFPTNMLDRLGDHATADTVTRILQIGSTAIQHNMNNMKNLDRYRPDARGDFMNSPLGNISLLVGEAIPEAVAHAGENAQAVLAKVTAAATTGTEYALKDLIEYYQKIRELSPEEQARITHLTAAVKNLDPEIGTHTSPFNKSEREPWRNESIMGQERRIPTWGDIGDMVRIGEQDRREYGIVIERPSQEGDAPTLDYLRGAEHAIKNKTGRYHGPAIFFHCHPSNNVSYGNLTNSLVSPGDVDAQGNMDDAGGGYVNIANVDGITIHIGAEPVGTPTEAPELQQGDSPRIAYTVQSGELKGSIMLRRGGQVDHKKAHGDMLSVLQKLKDSEQPYAYSAYDAVSNMRYYFVHVPWGRIDKTLDFYDLCFGDGLPKLMQGINDLPEITRAQNLREAMDNTGRISYEESTRRLEEAEREIADQPTKEPRQSINFRSRLRFPWKKK